MRRLRANVEREKLMLGSLPELSARLLDLVRDHGRLTIGDAERFDWRKQEHPEAALQGARPWRSLGSQRRRAGRLVRAQIELYQVQNVPRVRFVRQSHATLRAANRSDAPPEQAHRTCGKQTFNCSVRTRAASDAKSPSPTLRQTAAWPRSSQLQRKARPIADCRQC
jgi:hypothetical protein